jgi:hypothetical protein
MPKKGVERGREALVSIEYNGAAREHPRQCCGSGFGPSISSEF